MRLQYDHYDYVLARIVVTQEDTELCAAETQGHKGRGNPTYAAVIKVLGASMVTLPTGEIYTSVDEGVIDGFAFPTYGTLESR